MVTQNRLNPNAHGLDRVSFQGNWYAASRRRPSENKLTNRIWWDKLKAPWVYGAEVEMLMLRYIPGTVGSVLLQVIVSQFSRISWSICVVHIFRWSFNGQTLVCMWLHKQKIEMSSVASRPRRKWSDVTNHKWRVLVVSSFCFLVMMTNSVNGRPDHKWKHDDSRSYLPRESQAV